MYGVLPRDKHCTSRFSVHFVSWCWESPHRHTLMVVNTPKWHALTLSVLRAEPYPLHHTPTGTPIGTPRGASRNNDDGSCSLEEPALQFALGCGRAASATLGRELLERSPAAAVQCARAVLQRQLWQREREQRKSQRRACLPPKARGWPSRPATAPSPSPTQACPRPPQRGRAPPRDSPLWANGRNIYALTAVPFGNGLEPAPWTVFSQSFSVDADGLQGATWRRVHRSEDNTYTMKRTPGRRAPRGYDRADSRDSIDRG